MAIGIVHTKSGDVMGTEYGGKYKGITVFKGIPYARPPIGDLRWRPPQDPEPWDNVRVCDSFSKAPPQDFNGLNSLVIRDFYYDGFPEMSEDCLYLNICTGANETGEKRPVYIWHHGGGMMFCHAGEIEFNPQELARKGIVVVLINQRLNAFGYLSLPQLSAEQGGKSGNYGLMDQVKALEWVYENIEQFGGDPDNITIGGQSGGSRKTCALASTPASKGRVKRVINQTGLVWTQEYIDLKTAEHRGQMYLDYVGIDPTLSPKELRKLPWQDFLRKGTVMSLWPNEMVYDGYYVPCKTVRESFDKYLSGVDFLNSTTYGEADVFGECESGWKDVNVHDYLNKINGAPEFYMHYWNMLGVLYEKYDFKNLMKVNNENAWDTARKLASLGLAGSKPHVHPGGGGNMNKNLMYNRIFGMYMKERYPSSKCYSLLFSHLMPSKPEDDGTEFDSKVSLAWHSSDLWFSFASLREGVPPNKAWRQIDFEIADVMSSYFANFMKTGDPNDQGLPYWPASGDNYGYLEMDDVAQGYSGLNNPLDSLIFEFVSKEYGITPEIGGV